MTTNESLLEQAREFVNVRSGLETAEILCSFVGGSNMYNLAKPESDFDFYGIYQTPVDQLLSLHPPTETVTSGDKDSGPDHSYHELRKYITLILKGNPTAIEALFLPEEYLMYTTPAFNELRSIRHHLLTQKLVSSYIGYLSNQLKNFRRMVGITKMFIKNIDDISDHRAWKPLYHTFRLMYECRRVLNGESPIIFFPPGEERDFIMKIRNNDFEVTYLLDLADLKLEELLTLRETCALPDKAPEEPFNSLLIRLRLNQNFLISWTSI